MLGPSNGIEYERSSRQAGLLDRIVGAVRCLLPPPNMASDPNIHAKGVICKVRIVFRVDNCYHFHYYRNLYFVTTENTKDLVILNRMGVALI